MIIPVGVSRRHVHITKEVAIKLFGSDKLEVRNNLNQPGQFASTSTVDVKVGNNIIEHVRVVGPIRNYNQIEMSDEECKILGVEPPRRQSGDLEGSLPVTLVGPLGSIELDSGLIRAEMHIHMPANMADSLGYKDKQLVKVFKDNKYLFDTKIKISNPGYLEMHIDTEEEKLYDLHKDDEVDIENVEDR